MKQFEIKSFLNMNPEDKVLEAYKTVYEKNRDINKRRNQLILLMLVTVAFFFINKKSSISNIQLGPVSLSDYSFIEILIPGIFSYLLYEFILVSSHQLETSRALKYMNRSLYKYSVLLQLKKKESHMLYILLPYSASIEIARRFVDKEKLTLVEKFLIAPVFFVGLLPVCFGAISIWHVAANYWHTVAGKISVIFSVWMFLIMAILFLNTLFKNHKSGRENQTTGKNDQGKE